MKYSTLTNEYAKWLFPLIDRKDCGYMHHDGAPRPFNLTRDLEGESDYPPSSITRTHLGGHLTEYETLYYRSWHRSGFVLAMIDVDAKKGETDAQDLADWVCDTYFTRAYCEPSTRGAGRHVYGLFRVGEASPKTVNAALADAGKSLAILTAAKGFHSHVCGIYGTYTLWRGRREIHSRGLFGKIPRLPEGMKSLEHLRSAPIFLPSLLGCIQADAKVICRDSLSRAPCPSSTKLSTSESATKMDVSGEEASAVRQPSGTKASTSESAVTEAVKALAEKTATIANPLARMRHASSLFYHQHHRYARDANELVGFYESCCLNTGHDLGGRRLERAKVALHLHNATERPPATLRYIEDDYLPMIEQNVTDAVRNHSAVKYRYSIGNDLLAAALYAYTKAAFAKNRLDRMHSLSDEGLLAMFNTLNAAGTLKSRFGDKEKRVAVRQMLQLADLIVMRDGEHVYGGHTHGVGDKWGLGKNHVRYQEFTRLFRDVVDSRSLPPICLHTRIA